MTRILAVCGFAALAALAAAAPALAQQPGVGNPAATPAGTPERAPGMPATHEPNDADRIFAREVLIGGRAEVMFGKLAAERAHGTAVKQFAERMVQDHTRAGNELMNLAKAADVSIPEGLDRDHRTIRGELDKLNGAAFDDAYIRGQITDHQQTVQLLEFEIGSGQDPALKQFAVQALPVVMRHLQMAQAIATETNGVASRIMPREMATHRSKQEPASNDGASPAR
jgi:putative membrane protein